MTHPFQRVVNLLIAVVIGVFSINVIGVAEVGAANNGTLKVHDLSTPSGTESNNPKVCAFDFEGFGFDPAQDGYIVVAPKNGGAGLLTLPFGPASQAGYYQTANINDGSGLSLVNGDYAATLYGKDTGNPAQPNLADVKAKSKNFKVDCPPVSVTATAPTRVDVCGNQNDTYTIPATTGVIYKIGGNVVNAGTYPKSGNAVTVTAEAAAGYKLTGILNFWILTFTNNSACPIEVVPTAPVASEVCGIKDTITITATPGVKYYFNGVIEVGAGTHRAPHYPFFIKAVATSGHVIQTGAQAEWWFNFSALPCIAVPVAPTTNDECGIRNDTYTIPAVTGVTYYVNGVPTAAGTYADSGFLLIKALPQPGYIFDLHSPFLWVFVLTNVPCATPVNPTTKDECGVKGDSYTIPAVTGVQYRVNGVDTAAGTYTPAGPVQITAVAKPGYALPTGTTALWDFAYTNVACSVSDITVVAECSPLGVLVTLTNNGNADGYVLINGTQVDVAQGQTVDATVAYTNFMASITIVDDAQNILIDNIAFDCTPGMGSVDTPVPTVAATTAGAVRSTNELPVTGTATSAAQQVLIMITLAVTAYVVTFYWQNRRTLTDNR